MSSVFSGKLGWTAWALSAETIKLPAMARKVSSRVPPVASTMRARVSFRKVEPAPCLVPLQMCIRDRVAPFASPTVNVRRLKLKSQDVDKTIFYGDSLRQTGVTDEAGLEAMMLGWDDAENIRPSIGDVFDAPYNQGLIKKAWQPEPCTPEELDRIPDSGTVYKLSVTQSVNLSLIHI